MELLYDLKGHKREVWNLTWSNDGKLLISSSSDKTTKIWKEKINTQIFKKHKGTVRQASISPNDRYIATCSFDGKVFIYKKEHKIYEFLTEIEGHQKEVKSVCWNKDSTLLATCGRDRTVWIWENNDEEEDFDCVSVLSKHTQDVKFVKFNPTTDSLFSCSFDESIKLWREGYDDWEEIQSLENHEATIWQIDFSKDGNFMVSCGDDNSLIFYKRVKYSETEEKWEMIQKIKDAAKRPIFTVSWSKLNDLIAIGSGDNSIRIFGVKGNKKLSSFSKENPTFELKFLQKNAHVYDVNCVAWNPRFEGLLSSCSDEGLIKVWKYTK